MMRIQLILMVGLGSVLGGILRYIISVSIHQRWKFSFPAGTFLVNIIGCFFIGLIYEYSARINMEKMWLMLTTTGFLGGFTTFSAFSFETITMLRDGHVFSALVYVLSSVCIGLMATAAGIYVLRII